MECISRAAPLRACPPTNLRHDRGFVKGRGRKPQIMINCRKSLFPPLPPAPFVGLPIGDLKAARFAILPGAPRRRECIAVVTVKDHHHPLVAISFSRTSCVIDQEPDTC